MSELSQSNQPRGQAKRTNSRRLAKALLWVVIAVATTTGAALLFVSFFLPIELVATHVYAFSLPGAVWLFRLASVAFLVTGAVLFKARARTQDHLQRTLVRFTSDLNQLAIVMQRYFLEDKVYLFALLGITLVAIASRLSFLFHPMRYDEAFTVIEFAAESFSAVISDYHVPNNHIFHTLLVYVVYHLFGDHPWIIRLPVLISGIALVPISFLVARGLYNKQTGILTASLVAVSPLLINYSTNARGYMLVSLLFFIVLGLSAYVRFRQNRVAWLLIPLMASIGFLTIPTMLFPFGIAMIWLLLSQLVGDTNPRRRSEITGRILMTGILTTILTVMLYLPVFLNSGIRSVIANPFVLPLPWADFAAQTPGSMLSTWSEWRAGWPGLLVILLIFGFALSNTFHRRLAAHRVPVLLAVIIWCPLVLIMSRAIPYDRVWLFLLPLFLMVASSGIAFLFEKVSFPHRSYVFVILVVVSSCLFGMNLIVSHGTDRGALGRAEEITCFLYDRLEPEDRILASVPFDYELLYYFRQYGIPDQHLLDRSHLHGRVFVVVDNARSQSVEDVISLIGLTGMVPASEANVLQEFDSATLYEIFSPTGNLP